MARTERTDTPDVDPFTGQPETGMATATMAIPEASEMTFAALMALAEQNQIALVTDLDDRVAYAKADLVGKPIVITEWRLNPDGQMGEFVVVKFTTPDDEHGFFTDGSTGIREQLKLWMDKLGGIRPIFVPKGLRVSSYLYHDPDKGVDIPAETYYISNEK